MSTIGIQRKYLVAFYLIFRRIESQRPKLNPVMVNDFEIESTFVSLKFLKSIVDLAKK